MTGLDKVATLLLALDPKAAGELLGRFEKEEMSHIIDAMLGMEYVDHESVQQVLVEFGEHCGRDTHAVVEPKARALSIIENALGEEEARPYLSAGRQSAPDSGPFAALERLDGEQLADLLAAEHPQTIAIALAHIGPERAGQVVSRLPRTLSTEVVARMTTTEEAAPAAVVSSVGRALSTRAEALVSAEDFWSSPKRRYQFVASVLDATGRAARDAALDAVRQHDAAVAKEVRRRMFLFEDIVLLDSEALRKVLSAVDGQTIALALRGADQKIQDHFFGAISKRAAETIREEQDLLGERPESEIVEAQEKILHSVRQLQAEGEIVINRREE